MTAARDQIIEATCTLMELQGYHATGLNEIIKRSGSPKGSLYYYFPGGKEELTVEALSRVGEAVLGRIQHHLHAHADVVEAVSGFIRLVADNVEASGYQAGGPITTVAMETASTHDRLRMECERIYGEWRNAFYERLIGGGFPPERAHRLATLIVSALEGGIILCRTRRSPQPLHDVADEVAVLLAAKC